MDTEIELWLGAFLKTEIPERENAFLESESAFLERENAFLETEIESKSGPRHISVARPEQRTPW